MRCLLPSLIAMSLAGCDYRAPLDPQADPVLNVLSGTVVVDQLEAAELAPVFVALYNVDDPPPPLGTGAPITFGAVPADRFTGDAAGIQAASWSISEVPDGEYLVSALVDRDGDFNPLIDALAGATCGDWAGGHLSDILSQEPASVAVSGGEHLDDITLAVASEYEIERPVVYVPTGTTLSREQAAADPEIPQIFDVFATGIHTELLQIADPGAECGAGVPLSVRDLDGDGLADPHPLFPDEPSLIDIWPQAYLAWLGSPAEDGSLVNDLEEGEAWVGLATVNPYYYTLGVAPVNGVEVLPEAQLVWLPGATHILPDGSEEMILDPLEMPAGVYGLTLVAHTGQTWTVPNSLGTEAFPSTDPDRYDPATQATTVYIE